MSEGTTQSRLPLGQVVRRIRCTVGVVHSTVRIEPLFEVLLSAENFEHERCRLHHLFERWYVDILARVACPVVARIGEDVGSAAHALAEHSIVAQALLFCLQFVGAGEQSARDDTRRQERTVVTATAEIGVVPRQVLSTEPVTKECCDLVAAGQRSHGRIVSGCSTVVDAKEEVRRCEHVVVQIDQVVGDAFTDYGGILRFRHMVSGA